MSNTTSAPSLDPQSLIKHVNNASYFSGYNDIHITKVETGYAEGGFDVTQSKMNLLGGIHGGALYTLADMVSGISVASLGTPCVTLSSSMNYLSTVKGTRVICTAKITKHGRTVSVSDLEIHDNLDRLIATGTFTFYSQPEKTL